MPRATTPGHFKPPPSGSSSLGSSSVSWRTPKRRDNLRLEILSCGACLPLLHGNLFGPLFTLDLLGLLVGRLLDDAGGLHLLVGNLRRRRDRRGHLLRVGDERDTLGEPDVAQGEVLVHPETRDVDRQLLGNVPRQGLDLDLVGHLVQDASLADTRGLLRTRDCQRHRDDDPLAHVYRREVHVNEPARDRVSVHVHDPGRETIPAADRQVVERVVAEVLEGVVHHLSRDREHLIAVVAPVAVEHGRRHALRPQAPGVVFAPALSLFSLQVYVVRHSLLPTRLLEKLVLAHKDLAHRVIREDVPDGVGEERGDREHTYLIVRLATLQRQRVRDDDLFYRGLLEALVSRARENRVGRRSMDLRRPAIEDTLRCPDGGPARVYYVVYHDGALAFHLADDVRDLGVTRLSPELVHDGPRQAQVVRQALGHLHLPGVRGDHHRVLGVPEALIGEVIHERVHGGEVIHGEAEEALDLADVQVHRHHPSSACDAYHVRHQSCRYGLAGLGLAVLPRVGEPGEDRDDALRRRPPGRVDHDEKLHEVVVHRLAQGLHDENVRAPDALLVSGVHLTTRELGKLDLAETYIQPLGYALGELRIAAPGEEYRPVLPHPLQVTVLLHRANQSSVPARRRSSWSFFPSPDTLPGASRITRAGIPTASLPGGMSLFTTLPAPR